MSLVIKDGTVFLGQNFEKKDILLENGRIAAVGTHLKGDERLNAEGLLILPGLIDPHVHFREPGDEKKEDFLSGSRAAIAGGFTTVMDMPNNRFPTVTQKRLQEKIELSKKAICDVFFHFGGTDDNFNEVKKADPSSLKLYLGKSTGDLVLQNPRSVEKHFASFPSDRPIVVHACDHSQEEQVNLEHTYSLVEKVVSLAQKYSHRVHLAHVSTKKEIMLIKRHSGATVEVAPHHLFLSRDNAKSLGFYSKVYPPLRSEQKRIMLWSSLEAVDCIATDHAPHSLEDKEKGAAGFPGLETSLALMLLGCQRGLIDKIWVAQRMTKSVADIFGLKDRGCIAKGYLADITIVDPNKKWTLHSNDLYTKCGWSPFDGWQFKGKVHTVIKNGKPLFLEYHFM